MKNREIGSIKAMAALQYAGQGILPKDVIADEEKLFDRPKSRIVMVSEVETDLSRGATPWRYHRAAN